jgi:hypothetical protein
MIVVSSQIHEKKKIIILGVILPLQKRKRKKSLLQRNTYSIKSTGILEMNTNKNYTNE